MGWAVGWAIITWYVVRYHCCGVHGVGCRVGDHHGVCHQVDHCCGVHGVGCRDSHCHGVGYLKETLVPSVLAVYPNWTAVPPLSAVIKV